MSDWRSLLVYKQTSTRDWKVLRLHHLRVQQLLQMTTCALIVFQRGKFCSFYPFKTKSKCWNIRKYQKKDSYFRVLWGIYYQLRDWRALRSSRCRQKQQNFFQNHYTVDATKIGNETRFFNHSYASVHNICLKKIS